MGALSHVRRWRIGRGTAARLVALMVTVIAALACGTATAQQVWFGPRGPDVHPGGAADWSALFKPTPEWTALADKIQVFEITAGYIVQAPDAELAAAASNLAEHHIALALGIQSIAVDPTDRCGHEEGYGQSAYSAQAAEKLHRLGISVSYIALDEPIWFGHYESGPQGCRFPILDLANRVASNVAQYTRYFPNAIVGDIEPVPLLTTLPDWQNSFDHFERDFLAASSKSLSFLQTDVNWRTPSYGSALQELHQFAKSRGLKFGIIYNGDGGDIDDQAWDRDAIMHFIDVESGDRLLPDQAIIETWDMHPTHVLPDSSPGTLGYVVARYREPRAKLSAAVRGNALVGTLRRQDGNPIPHAEVTLKIYGSPPGYVPPVRRLSGIVPADARFAIIGMRVNTECLCAGQNDLLVGDLEYTESGAGKARHTYPLVADVARQNGRPWNGIRPSLETIGGRAFARIDVTPQQHLGFNSSVFAVTPGAHFEFRVPLGSPTGGGMFGTVAIIWLDAHKNGLRRTNLSLPREATDEHSTATDADGHFDITGISGPTRNRTMVLVFRGSATVPPAVHVIR